MSRLNLNCYSTVVNLGIALCTNLQSRPKAFNTLSGIIKVSHTKINIERLKSRNIFVFQHFSFYEPLKVISCAYELSMKYVL